MGVSATGNRADYSYLGYGPAPDSGLLGGSTGRLVSDILGSL